MIRINLMPLKRGRVSKKALDFRNFLMVVGASVAVVVLGGGVFSWAMASRVSALEAQKRQTQTQLATLKAQSAKIATFEEDRKTFEEKIQIINRLKTRQGRPVLFLDQVAHRLPERVWLKKLEESGGKVTVTGRALTNADIVDMIRSVKEGDFLRDVQLVESRRIRDKDLSAYEFTLTGNLPGMEPDKAPADAKAQPGKRKP